MAKQILRIDFVRVIKTVETGRFCEKDRILGSPRENTLQTRGEIHLGTKHLKWYKAETECRSALYVVKFYLKCLGRFL